jgi:F0F1-type ATP synthase membrane subunit b/b'
MLRLNEMSDFGEPLDAPFVYFLRGQMGKLSDFVSRGVRLIVVDPDSPAGEAHSADTAAPTTRAPRSRDIPAEDIVSPPPPPVRSGVAMEIEDFGAVYDEAGLAIPDHGYGVDKVAEMLQGKRLSSLGREVRATAVLAALEAAQVDVKDVIADAVRRDNALDAFEASKERELHDLRAKNESRVRELRQEMETLLTKINAEIERLKAAAEGAEKAFAQLQIRKRREEERLHEVVANFVEAPDNPITAGSLSGSTPPKPSA